MWSVKNEKIRQTPWFTHLLTDQPWFALPTETCNCLHVSTLFCTKIRFCCCNAHNHDARISSSQTHGFNSLWKMSSETHVIQKNSPHSTVPLKSNDTRADPLCPPSLPMWGRPTEKQPSPNCAHSSVGWLPLRGTQAVSWRPLFLLVVRGDTS